MRSNEDLTREINGRGLVISMSVSENADKFVGIDLYVVLNEIVVEWSLGTTTSPPPHLPVPLRRRIKDPPLIRSFEMSVPLSIIPASLYSKFSPFSTAKSLSHVKISI